MRTKIIFINKLTLLLIIVFFFSLSHLAFARLMTFEKEYVYQASEIDSKLSCRTIAIEQIKRLLLEELGTYLESKTEVKDYHLSKDQITIITAGIVKTEIVEEKWDGQKYYLRSRIVADPDEVAKSIDSLRKDRQKVKEFEEMRKKAEGLLKEVDRLKNELEIAKDDKDKSARYNQAIDELSAMDWFEKGKALGDARNYGEAIEAFNWVIKLDPKFALAYALRGICYKERDWNNSREQKEYFNQAISDFSKAIEIDPNNEKYIYLRGETYWRSTMYLWRGDEVERKFSCLKAIKDFNQLIKLNGEWKRNGYQLRAFCNTTLGNIQEALADYNQLIALEEHPFGLSQRHAQRGKFYAEMGDFPKAITDFNRAIELNPDFIYHYRERGEIHAKAGNYNLAIADFTKFIKLEPEDYISYEKRGNAYLNIGNHQKAITDFNTVIKIKPDRQYLYIERGNAYQKMGQYQKAISDYDRAIEINPKYSALAYCGRGEVFFKMANQTQAISDFDRAIEIWTGEGGFTKAYYGRGLAYIKKGDQKQGVDDIKTAARGGFKDAQNFLKAKGIKW